MAATDLQSECFKILNQLLAEKFVSSTFTNEGSKSSDILFSCPYTTSGFILLY